MKKRDLIRKLEEAGFEFKEHGGIMILKREAAIQSRSQDTMKSMR